MTFLFIYILKLSVSLAVVFTFYHFVLRKLTFYNWNRWYLLGYSLLSFFIAFIDVSPVLDQNKWTENTIVQWVPVIQHSTANLQQATSSASLSAWQWISLLFVAGMLVMLLRLLIQLISFQRIIRKAKPLAVGLLPGSGMKLYQVEGNIIPFSFGNSIFINQHLHTREELQEIVWHEFIHVKQRHSIDIICSEILCLLNWYNPFAWLLRRSIRQNLEFIADGKVLENGICRKDYQYLLLKVIGNNHFSIAPKFNFSSLKKRIAMMNKMKSAGVHIVKFLFILPLVAVLLVAFRNSYGDQPSQLFEKPLLKPGGIKAMHIDTVPHVATPNSKGYLIDVIGVNGECTIVVKDNKGKEVERVALNQWKEQTRFEEQYGEILAPPPQPPTPPANITTPAGPVGTPPRTKLATIPVAPTPPVPSLIECPVTSTTPTPFTTFASKGLNLSKISKEYEITDKKAEIKLSDGTVEKYDLTDPKEKTAFEKKYGKMYRINSNGHTTIATNVDANLTTSVNAKVTTNVGAVVTIPPAKTVSGNNLTTSVAPVARGNNGVTTVASSLHPRPSGLASTVADPYGHSITGIEDIVITITKNTSRQDLEKFKLQMKAKGVELDFDEIEYNEKGKLVSINGTMISGDSRSNFVATEFHTLLLAMIKKGDKTYFKVSTKDYGDVI